MKLRIAAFALLLFAALFAILELAYSYHFFYIEQSRMFLFSGPWFGEMIARPGGLAGWLAGFLVQFFALPGAGAAITAALITGAAVLTAAIGRRMSPRVPLYLLWVLPALGLLCLHFNVSWYYRGTVGFLMALGALAGYVRIARPSARLIAGLVAVPLLFWLGGSVALLFAVCTLVWEALSRTPRWRAAWLSALVVVEALLTGWGAILFSVLADGGQAFTPRLYFQAGIAAGPELWFAWIAVPLVIAGSWLCRGLKPLKPRMEIASTAAQLLLIALLCNAAVTMYIDSGSYKLKTLDRFARLGDWDAVIDNCRGGLDSYIYLNYLNLALAEKGVLAEQMFSFDQHGPEGLLMTWEGAATAATVLSDIHFRIGNVAIAQMMAFVWGTISGNTLTPGWGNPRQLQRLVQANLIYGEYPVARKYLDLLSQTLFYRDWAAEHRRFLYNDQAVAADPLLGSRQRNLLDNSFLSVFQPVDLEDIALQNPADKTAIEYLGAYLLLSKNMAGFRDMLELYYGTEVLPALPRSFREAVIILFENERDQWSSYGVEQAMIERFDDFRRQVIAGRGNSSLAATLRRVYGDTYWYYFMYKEIL